PRRPRHRRRGRPRRRGVSAQGPHFGRQFSEPARIQGSALAALARGGAGVLVAQGATLAYAAPAAAEPGRQCGAGGAGRGLVLAAGAGGAAGAAAAGAAGAPLGSVAAHGAQSKGRCADFVVRVRQGVKAACEVRATVVADLCAAVRLRLKRSCG
nr:hypothetical protein [Tanacetum cinerariifolium]